MGRPRTWTDDELEAAIAASTTYSEVMARLGLAKGGGSRNAVYRRVAELDLDDRHLRRHLQWDVKRSWTDEELAAAVSASTCLKQVFDRLDLRVGGSQWVVLRQRIEELELDVSHWDARRPDDRRPLSDERLREVVASSRSLAEVMRRLGRTGGGSYRLVRNRIEELDLNLSHMTGQGWSRGRSNPAARARRRPLDEILVENSTYRSTWALKNRLIEEGILEPACSECGITEWNGRPAPLHLDHINGDRRDNRLVNLRFLCPNCHAQTETYCGRNRGRYDPPVRDDAASDDPA